MELHINPRHPVAESVGSSKASQPVPTGELSDEVEISLIPCCFITTADAACGTHPRRVCIAHPEGNCIDVTAHYYDHRTGRLFG